MKDNYTTITKQTNPSNQNKMEKKNQQQQTNTKNKQKTTLKSGDLIKLFPHFAMTPLIISLFPSMKHFKST